MTHTKLSHFMFSFMALTGLLSGPVQSMDRPQQELKQASDIAANRPTDAHKAQVQRLRQLTADACLGKHKAPADVRRTAQPPMAILPVTPSPQRSQAPSAAASEPPALMVPRTSVITACDAGGCWDSEGARIQRLGPNLSGPNGPCLPQGSVFVCP